MRVERNDALRYYERTQKATVAGGGTHAAAAAEAPQKGDSVSISAKALRETGRGQQVQQIATEVETEVTPARLNELSGQIEAGEYHVPASRIADSMLNLLG